MRAQGRLRDVAHVDAVDQDAALERVVEARDEVDQAGLAGAAAADQGDGLAGLGADRDVLEDDVAGLVAEGDMLQVDAALDVARVRLASGLSSTSGFSSSDLEDAGERGQGAVVQVVDPDQLAEAPVELARASP